MCTVCLALRRSWAQWRTPPSPSAPTSLVKSQNGSMGAFWGTGLGSLRLETRSEYLKSVGLSTTTTASQSWLFPSVLLLLIRFNHWFDGMALLHQFKISNGQVTYKSRFLSSDSYQANKEHNRIAVSEFGTVTMPDPCKNLFQRFLSRFAMPSEHFIKLHEHEPLLMQRMQCNMNVNCLKQFS